MTSNPLRPEEAFAIREDISGADAGEDSVLDLEGASTIAGSDFVTDSPTEG
jgi:hypothetical protein